MENFTLFSFIYPFIPMVLIGMLIAGVNANKILDDAPANGNAQKVWLGYLLMLVPVTLGFIFSPRGASVDFKSELLLHLLYVYTTATLLGFPTIFILKKIDANFASIIIIVTSLFSTSVFKTPVIETIAVSLAFCLGARVPFFRKTI
jgi:hypothetical protein